MFSDQPGSWHHRHLRMQGQHPFVKLQGKTAIVSRPRDKRVFDLAALAARHTRMGCVKKRLVLPKVQVTPDLFVLIDVVKWLPWCIADGARQGTLIHKRNPDVQLPPLMIEGVVIDSPRSLNLQGLFKHSKFLYLIIQHCLRLRYDHVITSVCRFGIVDSGEANNLLGEDEDSFLEEYLSSSDDKYRLFARGIVLGHDQGDKQWIHRTLERLEGRHKSIQLAELLYCLPCNPPTWDQVESRGSEVDKCYWGMVSHYEVSEADATRAVRKLLEYDRPFDVLKIIYHYIGPFNRGYSAELALIVVEATLGADSAIVSSTFAYSLDRLLQRLVAITEFRDRLARVEWAYLPLMDSHLYPPRLLHQYLGDDGSFFAEVVAAIYPVEGEVGEEGEREATSGLTQSAIRAHDLLRSWRMTPGITSGNEVQVNKEDLMNWIETARISLNKNGRCKRGDYEIGKVLSRSPNGANDLWPHPIICEIVQTLQNKVVDAGFKDAVHKSRGVVSKGVYDGGVQERELSEGFLHRASRLDAEWPQVAALLRDISKSYASQAERDDSRVDILEDTGQL